MLAVGWLGGASVGKGQHLTGSRDYFRRHGFRVMALVYLGQIEVFLKLRMSANECGDRPGSSSSDPLESGRHISFFVLLSPLW